MEAKKLRDIVRNYIDTADEDLLQVVKTTVEDYKEGIVAYSALGEPLTRSQYKKDFVPAEGEIARGEVIHQKDLEKESTKW